MNILAIFCLNALSENEESHDYIRNSGVNFNINTLDKGQNFGQNSGNALAGPQGEGSEGQINSSSALVNTQAQQ